MKYYDKPKTISIEVQLIDIGVPLPAMVPGEARLMVINGICIDVYTGKADSQQAPLLIAAPAATTKKKKSRHKRHAPMTTLPPMDQRKQRILEEVRQHSKEGVLLHELANLFQLKVENLYYPVTALQMVGAIRAVNESRDGGRGRQIRKRLFPG